MDDDVTFGRSLGRRLERLGYASVFVETVDEVRELVGRERFDIVLSDLHLRELDGVTLVRCLVDVTPTTRMILMTGDPSLESALEAIDVGVSGYLTKPLEPTRLQAVLSKALQDQKAAKAARENLQLIARQRLAEHERTSQASDLEEAFHSLFLVFQPIFAPSGIRYAHEALLRCTHPVLRRPDLFIDAAIEHGRLQEVGRRVRAEAAVVLQAHPNERLFVNIHPDDLGDEELYDAKSPLAAVADRCVLEITERAALRPGDSLDAQLQQLRRLGYRLAIDDLGAGYGSLGSLAMVGPEVVKIDMSLVRDVQKDPRRQRLIRAITTLSREEGTLVVCEGIETEEERVAVTHLGADLLQGYLLGRPGEFPRQSKVA
ncbi:MAG: EAL domain-containing protein [Myxococcota bacterium]